MVARNRYLLVSRKPKAVLPQGIMVSAAAAVAVDLAVDLAAEYFSANNRAVRSETICGRMIK